MKRKLSALLALTMVLVLAFGSISVFAANASTPKEYLKFAITKGGFAASDTNGDENGNQVVNVTTEYFEKDGGGLVKWGQIVGEGSNPNENDYGLSVNTFKQLKKSEQDRVLNYILTILQNELGYCDTQDALAGTNITSYEACAVDSTICTELYNEIGDKFGVATSLVTSIMYNAKPDYVKANKITSPFMNVMNVIMAIAGIALMAFLGFTLILDLAYLALPAFRGMLEGKSSGGDGKGGAAKLGQLVSDEAVKAISASDGGTNGSPTLIYLKKKWVSLFFFMILLVALVSGKLFNLLSSIIDLVSGFFD